MSDSPATVFRLRAEAAESRVRELEQALQGVMKLIDDGILVREIKYDHEPGWAMRGFHLVMALQQAQAALQGTDKAAKNG